MLVQAEKSPQLQSLSLSERLAGPHQAEPP